MAKLLDILGLSAATLCLIHCIVFPLLMVLPLGLTHNPAIDIFFFLIGLAIVYRVTRKVASPNLRLLFWSSIFLIGISIFFETAFDWDTYLIFPGALGLISAHIINFRKHRH